MSLQEYKMQSLKDKHNQVIPAVVEKVEEVEVESEDKVEIKKRRLNK